MRVAIGSDHAGFIYKQQLMSSAARAWGTRSKTSARTPKSPSTTQTSSGPSREAVAQGEFERGIVLGGSGNGEQMVANKVRGVRCALCWDITTARLAREHNDANVISIGQRVIGVEDGARHRARLPEHGLRGRTPSRRIAKIEP